MVFEQLHSKRTDSMKESREKRSTVTLQCHQPSHPDRQKKPIVPSLSPSKALSLTHSARDCNLQGQGFLSILSSTECLAQAWHTEGEPEVVVQRTVISFCHQIGGRARTSACVPSPAEGNGVCRLP